MPPGRPSKSKKSRSTSSICPHCGRKLNEKTIQAHLEGKSRPQVDIPNRTRRRRPTFDVDFDESDAESLAMDVDIPSDDEGAHGDCQEDIGEASALDPIGDDHNMTVVDGPLFGLNAGEGNEEVFAGLGDGTGDVAMGAVFHQDPLPQTSMPEPRVLRPRTITIEDAPESEDEEEREHDQALDDEHGVDWLQDMEEADYVEAGFDGISLEDAMDDELERELVDFGLELTDDEIALLRHFALKIKNHMTVDAFESLSCAFPESNVQSWKVTAARAKWLSQFMPTYYDCCINSCCLFVGARDKDKQCFDCKEPQYRAEGSG
ncbi:hypothetical protein PM082_024605 [Marasmius tenuissimus]|nr:hypothetical protein PM082_024605 [Marasmius tenuissimus]